MQREERKWLSRSGTDKQLPDKRLVSLNHGEKDASLKRGNLRARLDNRELKCLSLTLVWNHLRLNIGDHIP